MAGVPESHNLLMGVDPRDPGRGHEDPGEWVRPAGPAQRRPPAGVASRRAPRARSSRGLPVGPTLAVAGIVVVLAFLLGRLSAGSGEVAVRATAAPRATTTTTTRDTTHTVLQGESLLGIASQYGVTLDALAAANGITNANRVFVGQVLEIPPPVVTTTTLPVTTTTKKR